MEWSVEKGKVRIGDRFAVSFQRTLRIPDDGRRYPLPPGLGTFPVHRVADYAERVPSGWYMRDGVFIPMYQREALWLAFDAAHWKPNAVKVGVGKINAVSGEVWDVALHDDPQDYLVCPDQPWLDGINAGKNTVRQFVAVPLGSGDTVEGQLTGREEWGGIQVLVFDPKRGLFPNRPPRGAGEFTSASEFESLSAGMGLAAGGRMRQKIYPDRYGIETWSQKRYGSLSVHLVNIEQYTQLTGLKPPPTPVSAQTYSDHKLPWFDLYDDGASDVTAPAKLRRVKGLRQRERERGITPSADDSPIQVKNVRKLRLRGAKRR